MRKAEDKNALDNGGTTNYWQFPSDAVQLQDLIEHKNMNYAVANILKVAYRLGDKHHSSQERDLNKVIWFAQRELARLKKEKTRSSDPHDHH
jgi:Flp pilus assembly CpaF family ATPase